jgi:tRNA1(Val) A37 N6-methylase TrmN6
LVVRGNFCAALESLTDTIPGRLELGAGGGLVGLTVASGCDSLDHPLYITDIADMKPLMQHNISLNGLDDCVRARVLSW